MIRGCPRHRLAAAGHPEITGNLAGRLRDSETPGILTGAVPASTIYFLYHPALESLHGWADAGQKRMTGLRVAHDRRPGADHRFGS
jgi:hypothetical protein